MISYLRARLLRHFGLWRTLVVQDLAVRYRGTLFGKAWPLLTPLAMLVVYGFVFGAVFKARWPGVGEEDHLGFALNLFLGLLVHAVLAETVGQAPTLLQRNSNFVRKMVFPLPVLVAVPFGAALLHLMLGFLLVCLANYVAGGSFYWSVLSFPLIFAPYVLLLYGIALTLAALGVYLRDLAQVVTLMVTVVLFTGAVLYPRSMVPPMLSGAVAVNPISWPVEALRQALFQGVAPSLDAWFVYSLVAVAVFATGVGVFRMLRPGFADVL